MFPKHLQNDPQIENSLKNSLNRLFIEYCVGANSIFVEGLFRFLTVFGPVWLQICSGNWRRSPRIWGQFAEKMAPNGLRENRKLRERQSEREREPELGFDPGFSTSEHNRKT